MNKNLWWSYSLQPVTSVWVSPASCCKGLLFEPMDVFSRMCLLSSIWWLMAPCVPEPVEIGTEWIEHFAIMWIDLLMDRWLKLACLNFGISKSSISRELGMRNAGFIFPSSCVEKWQKTVMDECWLQIKAFTDFYSQTRWKKIFNLITETSI